MLYVTKELEDMDTTRTNLLLTPIPALTIQLPYVQAFSLPALRTLFSQSLNRLGATHLGQSSLVCHALLKGQQLSLSGAVSSAIKNK